MSSRVVYWLVAVAALASGTAFWWLARPLGPPVSPGGAVSIAPGPLLAASFRDTRGMPHSLAELEARLIVVNFWATWCAPCREEMPAFARLQSQWRDRGVQFVGLANDDPAKVDAFAREIVVNYPLWIGADEVSELSRRLGNPHGSLPHTAIVGGDGRVIETRVGTYSEVALARVLERLSPKIP